MSTYSLGIEHDERFEQEIRNPVTPNADLSPDHLSQEDVVSALMSCTPSGFGPGPDTHWSFIEQGIKIFAQSTVVRDENGEIVRGTAFLIEVQNFALEPVTRFVISGEAASQLWKRVMSLRVAAMSVASGK